jgi:multiple sugar transport system permease protein
VEVELHHFTGIKVEGVETTLLAVAGKTPPDVLYVNFRQSDSYIQQGFLYPLDRPEDGYLAAMTEEEKAFRVHPKIWPVIHRRGPPRGDKHVWALPWGGALGKVCWYRKDLFDAAGLPYPKNDWTWEDFYQAARKLSAPGRGLYGVCFLKGKHESWNWVNFLWSAGGDVMTYDDATDTWTAVFDSREAAVALDFYTRLCTEPWTDSQGRRRYGYAYKDAWEAFDLKWQRGEIGMTLAYIDGKLFAQLNPDVTGMVPVPIGPTGIRGAELNSRMMGLYADIPDRAVRDAAWEFVRFFDCQDAVGIKTRVMVEGGLGRFVNPKYLRLFGYEELIRLAPRGWSDIFEIAINTGMPEPYGKDSNYAYDILTEPLLRAEELALDGKLPADREQRLDVLQGLLRTAKKKADEQMLGIVPPDVRATRRRTAVLVLLALVGTFVLVLRKVARAFTPPAAAGRGRAGWQFRRYRLAYLLLLPAVLTILVWQYVPLARGSVMAFMDYKILGGSRWVWLDNFGDLLWSRDWWHSIEASLRYSLLVIALTFLPPVVLAILLQEVPRGKMLFRTLFYLPAVMTGLVVVILWKTFYDPNETGMVNGLLLRIPAVAFVLAGLGLFAVCVSFARRLWFHGSGFPALLFLAAGILMGGTLLWVAAPIFAEAGVNFRREPLASVPRAFAALLDTLPEPYRWLGSSDTALFCCVLPIVWAGVGPGCLIYLAALKGISDDFYEAADVDGATFTDKMLFVVFPILKPLLVINFVGCFIAAWQSTANILAMTGGGYGTEVAALHIFYRAFIYLKLGPATAMAWMLAFLLIGFTIHQLTILSRLEFRTTGEEKK